MAPPVCGKRAWRNKLRARRAVKWEWSSVISAAKLQPAQACVCVATYQEKKRNNPRITAIFCWELNKNPVESTGIEFKKEKKTTGTQTLGADRNITRFQSVQF
jgi:hypothetical protein